MKTLAAIASLVLAAVSAEDIDITSNSDTGYGQIVVKYNETESSRKIEHNGEAVGCTVTESSSNGKITIDGEGCREGFEMTVMLPNRVVDEVKIVTQFMHITLQDLEVRDGGKMKLEQKKADQAIIALENTIIKKGGNNSKARIDMEGGLFNVTDCTIFCPVDINVPKIHTLIHNSHFDDQLKLHVKGGQNVFGVDERSSMNGLDIKANPGNDDEESRMIAVMYGISSEVYLHVDNLDVYLQGTSNVGTVDFKVKGTMNVFFEVPSGSTIDKDIKGDVVYTLDEGITEGRRLQDTVASTIKLSGTGDGTVRVGPDLSEAHGIVLPAFGAAAGMKASYLLMALVAFLQYIV